MDEIHPLRNTINSVLQRIKELQNEDGGEFQEIEEDAPLFVNYMSLCKELKRRLWCLIQKN